MIRSTPDFLSTTRLELDAGVRRAYVQQSLAPTPTGLRPAKHMPPAEHVSHAIVVGGPGTREFSRDGARFVKQVFTRDDLQIVADQFCRYAPRSQLIVDNDAPDDGGLSLIDGLLRALADTAMVPVVAFVETHGKLVDGAFAFKISKTRDVSSGLLFQAMGSRRQAPVQIFLTACHGQASLDDAHHLPAGSVVVALAPRDSSVHGSDVRALRANLQKMPCLCAFGLLLVYCACALKHRTPPALCMPDGTILELDRQLESCQGTAMSAQDRSLIHEQLDRLAGTDRVKRAIELVESGRFIPDADYGIALAVAAVLGGVTIAPWAVAEAVPSPMVHNVLTGAHELLDPPELNLNHPWVGDMFTTSDTDIALTQNTKARWYSSGNYLTLESGKHGLQVVLASGPGSGIVSVRAVRATSALAIEHFQRMGVFLAAPPSQARTLFDPSIAFFA